ncbi:uncharacterized protein DNG_09178 [Cephalotrichum gorgonifer]|uniref:Vacuolar protein sorting-associated protein 62 n=1 Tax=Cephalotrichum gorgonifer TaxID=2041049 RepID=A0AAE8N7A4_9PEZI|nr:uncharacterized protein DNG_09178 [Cephalotrichum gorgonifer]
MLWLHSDDQYMPSDLLSHIHHTTPMVDGEPIPGLPPLGLDNLEILNVFGDQVALTADEEDPIIHPKWLLGETPDAAGKIHNATPCIAILVEKSDIELDAFYFYFYSYNEGGNITQVLDPLAGLIRDSKAGSGMHFGDHVGDWEYNMIRYRDGKPIGIFFSQHEDGAAYDWEDPILSKTDGRPIIYSARGSHANYPIPGDHVHAAVLIDYCDEGPKWDPILSAYFYHFDPDTLALRPVIPPNQPASSPPPASNLTSFFYFSGIWGDKKYPDTDPRQETVPYFGIKRFVDEGGDYGS